MGGGGEGDADGGGEGDADGGGGDGGGDAGGGGGLCGAPSGAAGGNDGGGGDGAGEGGGGDGGADGGGDGDGDDDGDDGGGGGPSGGVLSPEELTVQFLRGLLRQWEGELSARSDGDARSKEGKLELATSAMPEARTDDGLHARRAAPPSHSPARSLRPCHPQVPAVPSPPEADV